MGSVNSTIQTLPAEIESEPHRPVLPLLSAVICTRNRPDLIAFAVGSVLANDDPAFELVVIDQSDTGASRRALAAFAADNRLRYVHTPRPGLSAAYNRAVREARGDLLAFTDDDCIAPPDWLATVRAEFARDPGADLVYGEVRAAAGLPGTIPALRFARRRRIGPCDGFVIAGMGANFAARRRAFNAIGGFDEVLGGGGPLRSSQDFDFQFRLFRSSRVSVLSPALAVTHYGVRNDTQWPATRLAYGIGDGAFYMKHVRCGDLLAARLLGKILLLETARTLLKPVLRRQRHPIDYFRGVLEGAWKSFGFAVDRRRRLYTAR